MADRVEVDRIIAVGGWCAPSELFGWPTEVPGPEPCLGVHRWERFTYRGGCQCTQCVEPVRRVLECAGCEAELGEDADGFDGLWEVAPWA